MSSANMSQKRLHILEDEMLSALRLYISARTHDTFAVYLAGLEVRKPLKMEYKGLSEIVSENEAYAAYFVFVAATEHGRLTYTVTVKAPRKKNSRKYLVDNPAIKWRSQWVAFNQFLKEFVSIGPITPTGEEGYGALCRWYEYNNTPFPFLELPKELRLTIYEFAIGDVYPTVKELNDEKVLTIRRGWIPTAPSPYLQDTHDPKDEVAPPNTALLMVNRQIRDEVQSVMFSSCRQSFADFRSLRATLPCNNLRPTIALKHIGLNFGYIEYLEFFGASTRPIYGIHPVAKAPASSLKSHFPHLERLDMKFHSTCWGIVRVCQKTTTIMILALAFEFICHIREVTLEGYIKNSTKREFGLALEEFGKNPVDREVPVWPMSRDDVFAMNSGNWPPKCHCRTECGFWGMKMVLDAGRQGRKSKMTPKEIFAKYKFDYED